MRRKRRIMNDLPVLPNADEMATLFGALKQLTDRYPNHYCTVSLTVSKFTTKPEPVIVYRAYAEPLGHGKEFLTAQEAVSDVLGDSRAKIQARRDALRQQLSDTEAMLAASPAIANPLPL